MALIEKVVQGGDKGTTGTICAHDVYGLLRELARGAITKQYILDNLVNIEPLVDEADLDWLIAQYQSRSNATQKATFLLDLWNIVILAQGGYPGYTDRADIIAKIQSL